MRSGCHERLVAAIMENSRARYWEDAVLEWEIEDYAEDSSLRESCICGQKHLRYLYTIRNRETNVVLEPIGSTCIQKFDRKDLDDFTATTERMFELLHAVQDNKYIELSSELFSRKLLFELYEDGAFQANEYNNYNGYNSYEFLLKMYNKRNKHMITPGQHRRIDAIILNDIKPYLQSKLEHKILR